MWELDCEEGWVLKNWCFWTVVLEKTLESPLECKEIQPVHPEGDQSWVFIGRTDAEAETPVLRPPHVKNWLIWKDPDAGSDWGQEEKGTTEDEMGGWHHWLNAQEFGWTPGVGDGHGGLAWCDSWGREESDTTERLNWTGAVMVPLGVLFSLQTEDQGLAEFSLSANLHPFDFNQFMLCPWLCHSFKVVSCPLPSCHPVSCCFPWPHPGAQCCLYNLLEGQPEKSWPLWGKYCIVPSPSWYSGLHLPCILLHTNG